MSSLSTRAAWPGMQRAKPKQPGTCQNLLRPRTCPLHHLLHALTSMLFCINTFAAQKRPGPHKAIAGDMSSLCRAFPEAFTLRCFAFEPTDQQVESCTSVHMVPFPRVTSGESSKLLPACQVMEGQVWAGQSMPGPGWAGQGMSFLVVYVVSCPGMSYPNLPCPVISCHVLPCPALPCPVLPCSALPCPVLSCHVLSCHVLSCHVMSCISAR